MSNIESIVRQINKKLVPQFEENLRSCLAEQNKEWLIEQIVRLTLDAHSLEEMDRKHIREEENRRRAERVKGVKALKLNQAKLNEFMRKYKAYDRGWLIKNGYLKKNTPSKGGDLITQKFRTPPGEELLGHAKDMLYGLLFGDKSTQTSFERTKRGLLTLTIPRMKSDALDFMKVTTELSATGIWQDPNRVANDTRADNVVLEIEYGEIKGEGLGNGLIIALGLINNLEINEKILYGRIENIEQSTLVT